MFTLAAHVMFPQLINKLTTTKIWYTGRWRRWEKAYLL